MNKEKLLQLISEAIDKGANVEVSFLRSWETTKTEMDEAAKNFSEVLSIPVQDEEYEGHKWLKVGNMETKIKATFHYRDPEEELPFADESIFLEDDIFLDDEHHAS